MSVCAIHQPNFFPWLGYFNKMERADVFVFLDDVAYPKSGSGAGSFSNRVKVMLSNQPGWLGCPVKRESGSQKIKNVTIDESKPWRKKALKSLMFNYIKTNNYNYIYPLLEELIHYPTTNLCEFNINAITRVKNLLNIPCTLVKQSSLDVNGTSTELLINITKSVGAKTYLCGNGARGYQDDEKILSSGLMLARQGYTPEAYHSHSEFIPGLSIIDFLMKSEEISLP